MLRKAVAEAGGTEVKNLGDGLMVAFASASAALTCAVAMQQAIDHDNRHHDHPMGLRIGLSGARSPVRMTTTSGTPSSRRPAWPPSANGGQYPRRRCAAVDGWAAQPTQTANRFGALSLKGLP